MKSIPLPKIRVKKVTYPARVALFISKFLSSTPTSSVIIWILEYKWAILSTFLKDSKVYLFSKKTNIALLVLSLPSLEVI